MKIVYILKKGFQYFPPCLAQVLYLAELSEELVVYHGENSDYIDKLFKDRQIVHYTFKSDKINKNKLNSYLNFITYTLEVKRILSSCKSDDVIWFGNCESAMTVGKELSRYRFVLTVLELYEQKSLYNYLISQIINDAEIVICCEKHRNAIIRQRYQMEKNSYIIPNKPYLIDDLINDEINDNYILDVIHKMQNKKSIIYQGIIRRDRPIANIAKALNKINDSTIQLVVMGKSTEEYEKELKTMYMNILFCGFIPNPEHLNITRNAKIGVAIYDNSTLNNEFCAPNKIYEYAAFGIPMVTSKNLGLTETVGCAGAAECVDFNSIGAVKNGIEKILNNYSLYSHQAKKFYSATDVKKIIQSILTYLNKNTDTQFRQR